MQRLQAQWSCRASVCVDGVHVCRTYVSVIPLFHAIAERTNSFDSFEIVLGAWVMFSLSHVNLSIFHSHTRPAYMARIVFSDSRLLLLLPNAIRLGRKAIYLLANEFSFLSFLNPRPLSTID